jgi:hypothetical protein
VLAQTASGRHSLKFCPDAPLTEDDPHWARIVLIQETAMDVMNIAKLATSIADTGTRQEVGIAMLKKAQDLEGATATQLLDAVQAASPAPNLPPHLGKHVNTTA